MKAKRTVQGEGYSSQTKALESVIQEAGRKHRDQGFKKVRIVKSTSKLMANGSWSASATVEGER